MKSPIEIENLLNSKRVPWTSLLKENVIPCEILVKYFDKIFPRSSDLLHSRVALVSEVYRKNGELFSYDLYEKFKSEREIYHAHQYFADIIDGFAEEYTKSLGKPMDHVNNHTANLLISRWGNGARDILKAQMSIHNTHHNAVEYIIIGLAKSWCKGEVSVSTEDIDFIRETFESFKDEVAPENMQVINMLYGLDHLFEQYPLGVLASLSVCGSENPESIEGFSTRLAEEMISQNFAYGSGMYDKQFFEYFVKFVAPTIDDEELRTAVVKQVEPVSVRLEARDLDWNEIQLTIHQLHIEELRTLFSRKDVPIDFLNKNAGYVTMLLIEQRDPFPYRH